jgi:hypothetical protein
MATPRITTALVGETLADQAGAAMQAVIATLVGETIQAAITPRGVALPPTTMIILTGHLMAMLITADGEQEPMTAIGEPAQVEAIQPIRTGTLITIMVLNKQAGARMIIPAAITTTIIIIATTAAGLLQVVGKGMTVGIRREGGKEGEGEIRITTIRGVSNRARIKAIGETMMMSLMTTTRTRKMTTIIVQNVDLE